MKTKEIHKLFCYIIHETTFEDDTSMAKNSEVIEKSVKSPNSNNISPTTTSTSPFTSLAKLSEAISYKYIKSSELTPTQKNKNKKKNMNNVEVDTNVGNEKKIIYY